MNTKTAYAFDEKGVFKGECLAYESPLEPGVFPLPANSTYIVPPQGEKPYVPVWDGNAWELKEDHRKYLNDKGNYDGGTPYWLPSEGDNYNSEPRYMTELGPLPEGAVLTKPEKPQNVIRKEELEKEIQDIKSYLESTDYVTLKIIEQPETKESYAEVLAKRKEMRAKVDPLQAELDSLV